MSEELRSNRVFLFIVLAALAVLGNVASLSLFFSVSLIFGSIFAIIALRVVGYWPGVIIAAIGASYTFVLWGHPYAIIIFTVEAAVVGLLIRRGFRLPVADLLYWLVIGAPLVILFYWGQIGMKIEAAGLIAVKQPINGIFNAVIAAITLSLLALYRPGLIKNRTRDISVSRVLFNFTLLLVILAGTVPMVLDSRNLRQNEEKIVEQLLGAHTAWLRSEIAQTTLLDWATSDEATIIWSPDENLHFGVINGNGDMMAHSDGFELVNRTGNIRQITDELSLWQPSGDMPSMLRWRQSLYITTVPLIQGQAAPLLYLEYEADPVVAKLDAQSAQLLGVIAILIVLAVLAAETFSRWLTHPLKTLMESSGTLVTAVTSDKPVPVDLPRSRIAEYDHLAERLETMSAKLAEAFGELQRMRNNLEHEVRDRTRELRRMSLVAEQTQTGVVITDRAGLTEWVNDGFVHMTGYKLDEMLGKKPGEVLQGKDTSPETVKYIAEAIAAKQSFEAEIVNYTKTGEPYWIEIISNPMRDENGIVEGFIAIESDITERKRLESSKDEFISSVNHELRTPLTSINGALSLIEGGAFGELEPKLSNTVTIAKRNSERLMALVNDILDVQRILSGKLNLDVHELNADTLMEAAIAENQSYAEQQEVVLKAEDMGEGRGDGGNILGDEYRLMQVMRNLISNAVKFSPAESEVTLSAVANGETVRFSVKDQGPGISEEFRSQIFGRFAQADASDTKEKGGTGLGLNISRGIVEEHGGTIGFDCPDDGGTVFYFDIPKA